MCEKKREKHESYGMLKINRVSNGKEKILFGSSIPHRETILLSIYPGSVERHLNHDWYSKHGVEFIEIEMSTSQFSEAISSLNQGSGVPVTIRSINGRSIEEPPFINKRIQFEDEFRERMEKLEKQLNTLTKETENILKNKKSINKGDRELILQQIYSLQKEIASNIPFIQSSFNEEMDKIVKESKAEIDAYSINKINQLGLSTLKEMSIDERNTIKHIEDSNRSGK